MPTKRVLAGRWPAAAALLIAVWLAVQVATALAASPDSYAVSQTVAQAALPTPTPFRFLTPTPFVPSAISTTGRAPSAGGFPLELAFPVLAVGLVAIGGGSLLLRRKTSR